jgi:hypothetical protein
MMTRAEFANARRAAGLNAAPIVLVILFGFLFLFLIVSSRFINWNDPSLIVAIPATVIPAMLFCILPIWFITRAIYRKYGLFCPFCGSLLSADPSIASTGKCAKCQKVILRL